MSAAVQGNRHAGNPAWLEGLRSAAFQRVSERGFPTARDDAWKYTRVAPIVEFSVEATARAAQRAAEETAALPSATALRQRLSFGAIDELAGDLGGTRLVFVNGHLAPDLSSLKTLPKGVRVRSLAAALIDEGDSLEALLSRPFREQTHAFTALNAACAEDGAFIQIPANIAVEEPIHLVFLSDTGATPLVSHPRSFVMAGAGSRSTIVETYVGVLGELYFTNAVTEVVLGDCAVVDHYKVQNEKSAAFHVALLDVRQGRASRFTAHSVALGASIARHEVNVRLQAPGAELSLHGLYMPRNHQHLDNPTTVEHDAPQCTSRQLYKGVVDGHGRGVFDGRIVVCPGAVKTDASQRNKNLLLSTSAEADTRPRLEILADDVKCVHGATVGQINEDVVFYLRSRGIPDQAARDTLTYAFVGEMLELISVGPLRSHVEKLVGSRLPSIVAGLAA